MVSGLIIFILPFTYEIMTKQGLLNRVKGGAPKNFYYVETVSTGFSQKRILSGGEL